jgi:hypothetical protein
MNGSPNHGRHRNDTLRGAQPKVQDFEAILSVLGIDCFANEQERTANDSPAAEHRNDSHDDNKRYSHGCLPRAGYLK